MIFLIAEIPWQIKTDPFEPPSRFSTIVVTNRQLPSSIGKSLRRSEESDGKAGGADAAIDVKHRASVLVPSVGVAVDQTTEVELTANDLQRQLAAMRVPG